MNLLVCLALGAVLAGDGKDDVLVAKVPEGCNLAAESVRFSNDGSMVAYAVAKAGKWRPVTGSALGGEYDEVPPPVVDPSGRHVAFRLMTLQPDGSPKWSVVWDGMELASDDWIGRIALSPSAGTPAFWVSHGWATEADGKHAHGPMALWFGKRKSGKWQATNERQAPVFDARGDFVASLGSKGDDTNAVVLDRNGREGKFGGGLIFGLAFRPDGHELVVTSFDYSNGQPGGAPLRFVLARYSTIERGSKAFHGRLGEAYDSAGSPLYSADGAHIGYKIRHGTRLGVAVDDAEDAPCEFDFVDELAFRPGTTELAYVACKECKIEEVDGLELLPGTRVSGGKWIVVHGAERSAGEYDRTRLPAWSPDGKRIAFAAKSDGSWRVVAGSKKSEPCDAVAQIVWAPDGRSVSYGCARGDELRWCRLAVE